jgi:pyruvate dehydrogenase E1 component alpha subunit
MIAAAKTIPEHGNAPDDATLIEIYRRSALIRKCGERLVATIRAGRITAPYYSPRGQEVVAAAMAVTLDDSDYSVTIYRGLHDHLAKGVPLKELWAEYAGKATGSCKGKGGPMHITHPASGVVITTGIVGGGIPIANGLALASQVKGDGRVTMCSFGDGATNIGAFHEALNMAGVWKLPVVFLCQNNLYAEHTSFKNGTGSENIAMRAASYGMPGIEVNGNDPIEMWRTARDAVARARSGEGPTLIEAKTFRFEGHGLGDDGHYIPKEEMAAAIAADPVPALRLRLLHACYATEKELQVIEEKIAADIAEAEAYAIAQPYPEVDELGRDVFALEVQP